MSETERIRTQKRIASMSDRIMFYQHETERLVKGYGKVDMDLFRLQAKILMTRIDSDVACLKQDMKTLTKPKTESERVSIQIAASDILLLTQTADILNQIIDHSIQIDSQNEQASKLIEIKKIDQLKAIIKRNIK